MHTINSDKLPGEQSSYGVYRVPAGYLQSQLNQTNGEKLQWHLFPRLATVKRNSLLGALSATLHFPDYFGHNWDAAWDCLSEQLWPEGQQQIVHLCFDNDTELAEPDLHTFIELMEEACQHWAAQKMACQVLIETDRQDSQTLNALKSL